MRYFLLSFSVFLIFQDAHSASICPENIYELTHEKAALAHLQSFNPLMFEVVPSDHKCLPQTSTHIAMGAPFCLFDGDVPVVAASVEALTKNEEIVGNSFLIPFAPISHTKIFASLKNRYVEILPDMYPNSLRSLPYGVELTALFKLNDVFIMLTKPKKGMEAGEFSVVGFTKEKYLDLNFRDQNTCK